MTALDIARRLRDALPARQPSVPIVGWHRTIALLCVPAADPPTTTRLLWRAQVSAEPKYCPELSPAEAAVLDAELRALAAATERTDPWTAARNLYGGTR